MPSFAHDDALVRHRRHIGAARGARTHHRGDLRNAGRRQRRLVVENAAEMVAVGKHIVLVRQIGAAGIDQIDARQTVVARDFLGAQMLLHGHRIIGAALHRRIVDDDDAFLAHHRADAGDDAGCRNILAVHAISGERRQLEEGRARIEQEADALARQELAAGKVALARGVAAAEADAFELLREVGDEAPHRRVVRLVEGRMRIERCGEDGHRVTRAERCRHSARSRRSPIA